MTASCYDRKAGRDFLVSGGAILLLTGVMVLIAIWYVKPRPSVPVPPARCRLTLIPPGIAKTAWIPIHFSLPSKSAFSRTVQPGDPGAATKLSPRLEEVRYLPREMKAETAPPVSDKPAASAFTPWTGEAPVFAPVTPRADGTATVESLEGGAVELPAEWASAAWPEAASWSVTARLEADADGRVRHVFLMPPAPPPAVAAKVEVLMRQARLSGGAREAKVRIGRLAPAAGMDAEGARP